MAATFNIYRDVSQAPEFNGLVGFSGADVTRAIVECTGYANGSAEHDAIVETLTRCGGAYRFAKDLPEDAGMYQPAMVSQLLADLKGWPHATLLESLRHWVPSAPLLHVGHGNAVLDYHASPVALPPLLWLLTTPCLQAPPVLNTLTLEDQAAAAAATSYSKHVQDTLARTLYFEGLLTHLPGSGDSVSATPMLCPPSQTLQRAYFDRLSEFTTMPGMMDTITKALDAVSAAH